MKLVNNTIEIYHVTQNQQGYYYCAIYDFKDDVNLLQIENNMNSKIFRKNTKVNRSDVFITDGNMNFSIFIHWSRWTKCSMCDFQGFKRKIGRCYMKLFSYDFHILKLSANKLPQVILFECIIIILIFDRQNQSNS